MGDWDSLLSSSIDFMAGIALANMMSLIWFIGHCGGVSREPVKLGNRLWLPVNLFCLAGILVLTYLRFANK